MNNDLADIRACAQSAQGLSRELGQQRAELPFPKRGGTRGYPTWLRVIEIQYRQLGLPTIACDRTIDRWEERLEPHQMTGNKERQSIIGLDLILLAVFYSVWPCGDADEACIFIYNNQGDVYTRNNVSKQMKDIQMTRKVTSQVQGFLPGGSSVPTFCIYLPSHSPLRCAMLSWKIPVRMADFKPVK